MNYSFYHVQHFIVPLTLSLSNTSYIGTKKIPITSVTPKFSSIGEVEFPFKKYFGNHGIFVSTVKQIREKIESVKFILFVILTERSKISHAKS